MMMRLRPVRIASIAVAMLGAVAGACDIVPTPRSIDERPTLPGALPSAPRDEDAAASASALAAPAPRVLAAGPTSQAAAAPTPAPTASIVFATSEPPADGASAVLWGYMDGGGVAHFASRQVDSRYSQVLRPSAGLRVAGKSTGPAQMLTWLEFSPDVKAMQPWVAEAASRTGVDQELLQAVIAVESGYDAKAVSPRGALGLMQLTPGTADRYATPAERRQPASQRMLDARTNILTGARMLADLTRRYGGIDVALAAWNAGEGAVRRAGGRMPAIAETEAHVHMVLELYWALLQRNLPQRGLETSGPDTRTTG